jgi:hypothetical protein
MRAMDPLELLFWGVMSLGVIVGFTTAYPFNVWLVAQRLKHGLMTQRKPHSQFDLTGDQHKPKQSDSHSKEHAKSHDSQHANHASMKSGVTAPQLFAVTSFRFCSC